VTRALAILLLLTGCGSYRNTIGVGPEAATDVVVVKPPDIYTRADVDAINAELQCRQIARTMLQASRCGIRR